MNTVNNKDNLKKSLILLEFAIAMAKAKNNNEEIYAEDLAEALKPFEYWKWEI